MPEPKLTILASAPPSYHDECRALRMCLIDILARPCFGHRSWADTLRIGEALIELDRQAEAMDREAHRGAYSERPETDYGLPDDAE